MGSVVLVARFALAGVFATAGIAKLLDRRGSRGALAGFGVPERALSVAAIVLPVAEITTAVALVPTPSARWGGLAAFLLLLMFIAGITNALVRGRAPDCHCFGQLHSAPAGRGTLARNAAIAVPAAIVALEGPGPAVDDWVGARSGAELAAVAAATAVVLLGGLALRLWHENRGLRRAASELRAELASFPPGLPVGAPAPEFSLPTVRGERVTLEALRALGLPVALVFVSPGCGPCTEVFPAVGRWQSTLAGQLTVALVSSGTREENLVAVRESGADVLLQDESEVIRAYRVWATPATVMVTPEGRVASAPASGSILTESLIRVMLRRHAGSLARAGAVPSQHGA